MFAYSKITPEATKTQTSRTLEKPEQQKGKGKVGNTDIRLRLSFRNHPKTKKLRYRLNGDAVLSFIWLMMFAAESKPNGLLDGMDSEDVALAADWQGDPDEFVDTLVAIRYLDKVEDGYRIHDWADNNPWAAGAEGRSKKAKKAANARWGRTENQQVTTSNNAPSNAKSEKSNAPSPSPSPSPIPKSKQKRVMVHPFLEYCDLYGVADEGRAFLEMRKKQKKPATERAETLLVNALEKLVAEGNDRAKVIDQSTEKCWLSFYEVSNGQAQHGTRQQTPRETASERSDRKERELAATLGITL